MILTDLEDGTDGRIPTQSGGREATYRSCRTIALALVFLATFALLRSGRFRPLDVEQVRRSPQKAALAVRDVHVLRDVRCTSAGKSCCGAWSSFYGSTPISMQPISTVVDRKLTKDAATNCRRLLLIIIFNAPFFQHIPFLESLYGKLATKIVYYSDIEALTRGVHGAIIQKGYFQHRAIANAMKLYPDYDGYLWIADDLFVNYPAVFSRRDFNNVWTYDIERPLRSVHKSENDPYWHWKQPWGKQAAQAAYKCLPDNYSRRCQPNLGCRECVAKGGSDIGFIPRRLVPSFMELAYVFRDLFFEIAIPTILRLMVEDVATEIELFRGGLYIWGPHAQKASQARVLWRDTSAFVHSTKFSDSSQKNDVVTWLNRSTAVFPNSANYLCKPIE